MRFGRIYDRGLRRLASLITLLAAACSFSGPGYDGTRYRCDDQDPPCPDGFLCVAGECVPPGAIPDAMPPVVDAPPPPDAAPPDAAPLVMTFGERPTADQGGITADTYLDSSAQTTAPYLQTRLYADSTPERNILIRFTISALPAGSQVIAATLTLHTGANAADALEDGTADLYQVLDAWTSSQATWLNRQTGVPWASPGAKGASRSASPIASYFPGAVDEETSVELPVDLVQGWVDGTIANDGVELVAASPTGHGVTFYSSDDALDSKAPLLTITYWPAP